MAITFLVILLIIGLIASNNITKTAANSLDIETASANTFQGWSASLWTQTSQADFEAGISNNIDTSTSSGDVILATVSASPPTLVGSWTGETDYNTNGFNYTPGAGSNRIALVTLTAESNSFPVANINQVTLGGQSLTAIESSDGVVVGSAGSFHNIVWVGYLNETGIGNMSGNVLNIIWDTTPINSPPIMVQAATYQNVDQTTPIADSASNTNTSAGTIQAGSVSVGEDDRLVYVTVCGNPADHSAPGGYTEQLEQDGPINSHSNASVQRDATTASTENPTATWSTTQRLAIISAVLNAAAGGSGYVSPGTLASQVLDTGGAGTTWNMLFWDETLVSNTDITFEVRASDTPFNAGDASPSWTNVGGTSPVITGLPNGRYKQWRVILTTSDAANTPTMHEVRLYYY